MNTPMYKLFFKKRDPVIVSHETFFRIMETKNSAPSNKAIDIPDEHTLEPRFWVELSEISGWEPVKPMLSSGMRWICDYGTPHRMDEKECRCAHKFRIPPGVFQSARHKLFPGKNILTPEEQARVRAAFTKRNITFAQSAPGTENDMSSHA